MLSSWVLYVAIACLPRLTPGGGLEKEDATLAQPDCVILLHGLGRTAWSMKRIEWALRRRGYEVINLTYPSLRMPIERLAREHVAPAVEKVPPGRKVHFVTHSLGGILVRQFLAENPGLNLGRVVMLGPPNQGSQVVDRLRHNPFYRMATGPSGQQLGTRPADLPRRLGPVTCEMGVIAGDRSWNPALSSLVHGPHDGKVSVAETRLDGMRDFIVLHASHTWMMWKRETIHQVVSFIESGRFRRPSDDRDRGYRKPPFDGL
jgi:triacylglycerol lipase